MGKTLNIAEGIMSPTGMGIRNDAGGNGNFGARRKKTVNGKPVEYEHEGTDYQCIPGQAVFMPFTGQVVREARPYTEGPYTGVLIKSRRMSVKIFYMEPYPELIGQVVKIGMPIGKAQDISQKYKESSVTPHIHIQIEACDPDIFFNRPCDSTV